jgi:hypothetical protein
MSENFLLIRRRLMDCVKKLKPIEKVQLTRDKCSRTSIGISVDLWLERSNMTPTISTVAKTVPSFESMK